MSGLREAGRSSRNSDWVPAVLGAVLSAVASVALAFTPWVGGVESLLIGLAGVTIGLLIEVLVRVAALSRDGALTSRTGAYAVQLRRLASLTGDVVEASPPKLVRRELTEQYDSLVNTLEGLRSGRIVSRDQAHLVDVAIGASRDMLGVTNAAEAVAGPGTGTESLWWLTPPGRRYWDENVAALGRGVKIRRIFICDTLDPTLRALLDQQRDAGVQVRVVASASVEPAMHRNFLVADGEVAWEGRTNARGVQVEYVLSHDHHDIARLERTFARLEIASEAYP